MEKVRLGVVGCGVIGRLHLKAAAGAEHITLAGVADQLGDRAAEAAREFGGESSHRAADDLIADPAVDAVVLAMPAAARADLGLHVLRAGKHLLTEKPPALNAGQIDALLAVQGDRVAACCSSRYRFYDSSDVATKVVASGALGELREVYCRIHKAADVPPTAPPPPWRLSHGLNGGGIAVNWSSYDLDYLLGICGWGLKPEMTLARTWPVASHLRSRVHPDSDAESHYAALITCAGGAAIHIERSEFSALRDESAWQVIGSAASLRLTMPVVEHKQLFIDETNGAGSVSSRVIWEGQEEGWLHHRGPVTDFCQAILTGREPKTSLRRALVIQQIFDSIYVSAARGTAVEVGARRPRFI